MDQWLVRTAKNFISGPFSREHVRHLVTSGQLGLQDEICQANGYWIFLHEREEVLKQLGVEVPKTLIDDEEITQTETETVTETEVEEFDEDESSRDAPRAGAGGTGENDEFPELAELPELAEENTAFLNNRMLREFRPISQLSKSKQAPKISPHTQSREKDKKAVVEEKASPGASAPISEGSQEDHPKNDPTGNSVEKEDAVREESGTPISASDAAASSALPSNVRRFPVTRRAQARSTDSSPSYSGGIKIEGPSFWRGFAWLLICIFCFLVVMVLRLLRSGGT